MVNLLDAFTGAGIERASQDQMAAIRRGLAEQAGLYGEGRGAITTGGRQALERWGAISPEQTAGAQAYGRAVGAYGVPGMEQARSDFRVSPGFQFEYSQMLDAANRAANARGVAVGNNVADVMDRTQGLASREWGNYVKGLEPYLGLQQQTTGAMAGIDTNTAMALANLFQNQGNAAYTGNAAIGQAQAQGDLAGTIAGNNLANLGVRLASAFAGPIGGAMGGIGGAIGGGMFNMARGQSPGSPLLSFGQGFG